MILGRLIPEGRGEIFYLVFRVLVGGLFLFHGLQKFGFLGGAPATENLFILAGFIELIGGTVILLGLLTRLAALIGALEMVGAYFMVHVPNGLLPISNGGELALLYLAAFIGIFSYGSGKYGLEKILRKKEIF